MNGANFAQKFFLKNILTLFILLLILNQYSSALDCLQCYGVKYPQKECKTQMNCGTNSSCVLRLFFL